MFDIDQVREDQDGDYILAAWVEGQPMYRKVMSEAEIKRAAMEEWLDVIYSLWEAIGKDLDNKPLNDRRFSMYAQNLRKVPLGLLKKGVEYAICNNKYSNIPPLGEIWKGIREELKPLNLTPGTNIAEAMEIWIERWKPTPTIPRERG